MASPVTSLLVASRNLRFALRPKWLLGHLLVVALVGGCICAGFWQLRRLEQRRETNALISAQQKAAPVAIEELVRSGIGRDSVSPGTPTELDRLRYRAVSGRGRPMGEPVTVRSSFQGSPGSLVYQLVELENQEEVFVLRGFVPQQIDGSIEVPGAADDSEEASASGYLIPIGRLPSVSRQALRGVDGGARVAPVIVQANHLSDQERAAGLELVPLPTLDEGPHLSYAVQWFLFATVGVLGYPILLARTARASSSEEAGEGDETD